MARKASKKASKVVEDTEVVEDLTVEDEDEDGADEAAPARRGRQAGGIEAVINRSEVQPNWVAFAEYVQENGGPKINPKHVGIVITGYKKFQKSPEALAAREQAAQEKAEARAARVAAREAKAAERAEKAAEREQRRADREAAKAERAAAKKTTAAAASKKGAAKKATKATPKASAGKATKKKGAAKKAAF